MNGLADWILSEQFVRLYCGCVGCFFVLQWARLWGGVRSLRQNLRSLTKDLDEVVDPAGFPARFEEYSREAEHAFGAAWTEFVETLVIPAPGSEDPIRNTEEAGNHLNEAAIVAPRVSLAFYQSVPNLLTGFGILGTFLGLAVGVGAAATGVSSGVPEQMTAALTELLDGASLAFLTSICGVGASIWFVLVERRSIRNLQRDLDGWVAALERRLERITPASVALKQLEAERRTARQVESFNTDLAFTLSQALEEKVAGRLSPLLEQLVTAVEELRSDRGSDAERLIKVALGGFAEAMKAGSGDHFDEMSAVLENLNRTLASSSEQFARSQEEVGGALDSVVASVRESLEAGALATAETLRRTASESAEQVRNANRETAEELRGTLARAAGELAAAANEMSSGVTGSTRELEAVAGDLALSTRRSRDLLEAMGGFVDRLNGARETMEEAHRAIGGAAARVSSSFETIRASSDRTVAAVELAAETVGRIERLVDALGEYQASSSAAWTSYRERFEGIDASLARVFQGLDEGLTNYCIRVQEFASELDGTTSRTIQSLASATTELDESIAELGEVMDRSTRRR